MPSDEHVHDQHTESHTKKHNKTKQNKTIAVETNYENRPEGYDRLGTYASGWNVEVGP